MSDGFSNHYFWVASIEIDPTRRASVRCVGVHASEHSILMCTLGSIIREPNEQSSSFFPGKKRHERVLEQTQQTGNFSPHHWHGYGFLCQREHCSGARQD